MKSTGVGWGASLTRARRPMISPGFYVLERKACYGGASSATRYKRSAAYRCCTTPSAVALDPGFAEAYVALALCHSQRIFSWAGGKDDDAKAFVALDKAVALNPDLPEAYVVRSLLSYDHLRGFDTVNSVANDKKAIALNPNYAEAHQAL